MEAEQRQGFRRLPEALRSGGAEMHNEAADLLWKSRRNYSLQGFPGADRGGFTEVVLKGVESRGWLHEDPPPLRTMKADSLDKIASIVPALLAKLRQVVTKRHYSLLTKFLHFLYPETFPIYDSQAADSIRTWAYFEFRQDEDQWKPYSWSNLADTSGNGYVHIMRFYARLFCDTDCDRRTRLQQLASELESLIGGRVTVLDLVDKLLWQAKGHPVHLGLLEPLP